jgi:hypothetical protein
MWIGISSAKKFGQSIFRVRILMEKQWLGMFFRPQMR